jgi:hypothetical protein
VGSKRNEMKGLISIRLENEAEEISRSEKWGPTSLPEPLFLGKSHGRQVIFVRKLSLSKVLLRI